jgi:hypothetical protein
VTFIASRPDPLRFDPVRFPGATELGPWPPPAFDFASPALREPGLCFERDAGGEIALIRHFGHLRVLIDIDRAHTSFQIAPGSRDFLLLRLIPAALRFVDQVAPEDPIPPQLQGEDPPLPEEHHVYAATTTLVGVLAERAGEEALALSEAIRRVPPGGGMFERAVARCVTRDGLALDRVAPLARRLQRLANAHAAALAAAAAQPDFAGMERRVGETHLALENDRRWTNDLLTLALSTLKLRIDQPRLAVDRLQREAEAALRRDGALSNLIRLGQQQQAIADRLTDLAMFWNRNCAAWLAVHPETTDRREIEALARNTIRRLSLTTLYAPIAGG